MYFLNFQSKNIIQLFLKKYYKIIHNISWLFFDKLLRLILGVFISILMARFYGPKGFGEFNFVLAYVTFFSTVATLGLDSLLIRDFVKFPKLKNWYITTSLTLRLFSGFILYILSILFIYILKPAEYDIQIYIIIFASSLIFNSFDVLDLWFQSQIQSKYSVIAKLSFFLIFSAIRVYFLYKRANISIFIILALLEIVFSSMALITIYYFKYSTFPIIKPKRSIAIKLTKESWPAIITSFAIIIYMKIDQIMISVLSSNEELGIYSVALKLSEIWYFIPSLIISSIIPNLISLNSISQNLFLEKLKKILYYFTILSYLIAIIMTFLSPYLINFIFGPDFMKAGPILAIHIWSAIFVFIGVASSPWYTINGLLKYSMYQTIIGALINVTLNFLLIPRFGALGASISTVIAYALGACILNYFFTKTRVLFFLQFKSLCLLR